MNVTGASGGLSDDHRDHLVQLLREHFAAGQFDVPEFGRRVEVLLGAATADEAAAALEDLPALTESTPEPRRSWWRRLVGQRHAQSDAARAGRVPTSARFRDPATHVPMRAWEEPADPRRQHH